MKMTEPIAHFVRLEGLFVQAKKEHEGFTQPLYDKQALIDLLEAAAEMCELFDATDPKYLAVEIRRMKEKL